MKIRPKIILFVALALSILVPLAAASDKEIDCLKCHAKLKSGKVVHQALDMGCPTCHTGIDARTVPHKKTNKIARGLSGEQPDLCYGCHDKAMFSKKTVHPPVAGGMCLSCHSPHSSDQMALLLKAPLEVCLECHPDIPKKKHAIAAFSSASHPVGLPKIVIKKGNKEKAEKEVAGKEAAEKEIKEERILMDPSRPDKVFYCGSCHNPHSTPGPHLLRFNATSTMGLCSHCHKM